MTPNIKNLDDQLGKDSSLAIVAQISNNERNTYLETLRILTKVLEKVANRREPIQNAECFLPEYSCAWVRGFYTDSIIEIQIFVSKVIY